MNKKHCLSRITYVPRAPLHPRRHTHTHTHTPPYPICPWPAAANAAQILLRRPQQSCCRVTYLSTHSSNLLAHKPPYPCSRLGSIAPSSSTMQASKVEVPELSIHRFRPNPRSDSGRALSAHHCCIAYRQTTFPSRPPPHLHRQQSPLPPPQLRLSST
ncbi:hypothetical protein LZ31DRAFT_135629 [Colletotrichum somersetense]|nr:hypothetical protein LZ31DRAFT_135629 [Colletotrichum somersetense]